MNKRTVVPRNFLLLDALNNVGNYTHITYGLADEKDYANNYVKMEYWNVTFMYDDGEVMNIFEALCRCSQTFPKERPTVTFNKGGLEHRRLRKLCQPDGKLTEATTSQVRWTENMSLGDYLSEILRVISAR